MSTLVAYAVPLNPPRMALCCARTTRVCPTPTYSGPTACTYSCPVPVCPVHHDDTQLYCAYQCFAAAHPIKPPYAVPSAPPGPPALVSCPPPPPPLPPTRVGKYVLGKTLGRGTFGVVRLAVHADSGVRRAVKVIDRERVRASGMSEQLRREIQLMKVMQHDNVVQSIEVLASPTTVFLVLELVTGGELFDVIAQHGLLEEEEARRYFRQLVSGLSYCHQRGVCDRDLKPENLLLDDERVLKISGFGLATVQQRPKGVSVGTDEINNTASNTSSDNSGNSASTMPPHLLHTSCGTPNYVAPEVLMDKGYNGYAADVWSAGVILYVLLAGFLPFDEVSMVDLFRKIMKADFSYPQWFSADAKQLLSKLITPKVDERYTMQQILEHPWMTVEDDEVVEGELDDMDEYGETVVSGGGDKERTVSVESAVVTSYGLSTQPSPLPSPRLLPTGSADSSATAAPSAVSVGTGSLAAPAVSRQTSDPPGARPVSPRPPSPSASPPPSTTTATRPLRRTASALLLTMDEDEEEEELRARCTPASTAPYYGPRILNAFDFINMVGGAAMNRMFSHSLSHSASFTRKREVRQNQFTSNEPWQQLLARLERVMSSMDGVECRRIDKYALVRAVRDSGRGVVGMAAQVHEMTPQLYMVECRKTKGDVFVYNELYNELKRRMVASKGTIEVNTVRVEAAVQVEAVGQGGKVRGREMYEEERKDGAGSSSGSGGGSDGSNSSATDSEAAVIRAGRQTLTIQRPGNGSSGGLVSTGSNSSNSSGGGGSGLRPKLNIVVTPNTPLPAAADEAEDTSDASGGSTLTPSSLLYNHTPNSSDSSGQPTTPQPEKH